MWLVEAHDDDRGKGMINQAHLPVIRESNCHRITGNFFVDATDMASVRDLN